MNELEAKKFQSFLTTGDYSSETAVEDAMPLSVTLAQHDKRFHPHGFDPKKDRCKFREQLAKSDNADLLGKAEEEEAAASGPSINEDDIEDLHRIRDTLEGAARLLNGRTGNLAALQASRRWQHLNNVAGDKNLGMKLDTIANASQDPATAQAAKDLKGIYDNIVKSSQNGWTIPAGMVPDASDLPQIHGQQGAPSGQIPAHSHSNTPQNGGAFTDDDAKAMLVRAAKSVNHHIDKGDFTPNAKAISNLHAAEQDIRKLGDKQLEQLMDDIFASEKGGFQTKIGKVPMPSQAWQQAHMPTMPAGGAIAGILGALFGGMGGAPAAQAPGQPVTTKKNPWVPFQAPSSYANTIAAINANNPAATDPNYWKDKADAMTPQQAVQDMEAKGSIVKGGYHDTYNPNDPDEAELWAGWKANQKLSDDTARCAAVCFDDLRSRFPNMPWKANLELRCGTKAFTGGQSTHTQDWRRHTVLFNCDYGNIWPSTGLGKSNYGHSDARFPFDVLRHEMGHALISGVLPNGKRMITKWHDAMTKAYGYPADDLEKFAGTYVSSYAVTRKTGGFSMAECLSECFSLATSPDYKPGYLPPPVEEFIFSEMLGVKPDA